MPNYTVQELEEQIERLKEEIEDIRKGTFLGVIESERDAALKERDEWKQAYYSLWINVEPHLKILYWPESQEEVLRRFAEKHFEENI